MLHLRLASKKNVILLLALLVFVVMLASYGYQRYRLDKQLALGGQMEVVMLDRGLSPQEMGFLLKSSNKVSVVTELVTPITLSSGMILVSVRAVDQHYPMMGAIALDRSRKEMFSGNSKAKQYGVAVNQAFLDQTGLKVNEFFAIHEAVYQIRGMVMGLPDATGIEQLKEPLMVLPHESMRGSEMFKNAMQRTIRHRILTGKMTPRELEKQFRQRFPKSTATIRRWNS